MAIKPNHLGNKILNSFLNSRIFAKKDCPFRSKNKIIPK